EINITPLVDVVLVLLIIFMLTAPVIQSGIEVAVPKTRTVKEITQQRIVVSIDKQQQVFLNNDPVNINQIATTLQSKLANTPTAQRVIYLRADQDVPFGSFEADMDSVIQACFNHVISVIT